MEIHMFNIITPFFNQNRVRVKTVNYINQKFIPPQSCMNIYIYIPYRWIYPLTRGSVVFNFPPQKSNIEYQKNWSYFKIFKGATVSSKKKTPFFGCPPSREVFPGWKTTFFFQKSHNCFPCAALQLFSENRKSLTAGSRRNNKRSSSKIHQRKKKGAGGRYFVHILK